MLGLLIQGALFALSKSRSLSQFKEDSCTTQKIQEFNLENLGDVNQYFNICPKPSEVEIQSFYHQDEVTQLQIFDNSFTGLSAIKEDMLLRGWNFNRSGPTYQTFVGGEVVQQRGKWNSLRNPVYVPASYTFRNWGDLIQCPPGFFVSNLAVSSVIGNIIFFGLYCQIPDTTNQTAYSSDCISQDLDFSTVCPDDYWLTGFDLRNNKEQIICCSPLYTCQDATCSCDGFEISQNSEIK
ncbi:UNKNOWN [Stylonychia lemnae]|uniref:Uncharacterized protein n=1 Tax=Stylonychia lemnae TaxID=5949 RepID=A0A077ZQM6_STYLE|nr:UNKNOWN [Stylonychia lemnae]|eukprot:CDW71685.1 UNKNOWN [Stylonychia lemnae]